MDVAQAEIDQPDRELPEGAEQRGVRVVQRQEGAVLVVVDERRVERAAAEHAGADEVPERRADDIGIGEPVLELLMRLDEAVVVDRLDDQEHQRQHLDEGEHAAHRHPHAGTARPVKVMAGTDDAAQEIRMTSK